MPSGHELRARLDSVLEALYLMFNEGYAAAGGRIWCAPMFAAKQSGWRRCWPSIGKPRFPALTRCWR